MKIDNVNVLDHGYVRLVNVLGDDLSIVRAARVSHNAEWRTGSDSSKDENLLAYMMDHGHTSPFEHVVFTFEVQAPLFVFRQWHRHRTWSYNEVSGRYTAMSDLFYVPAPENVGVQSRVNKQGRDVGGEPSEVASVFSTKVREHSAYCYEGYKLAIDTGVPRELARLLLPLNVYTRMFATVDLHNLFGFLRQRMDEHSQFEIRTYAEALFALACQHVPTTAHLWLERQNEGIRAKALVALQDYIDRD